MDTRRPAGEGYRGAHRRGRRDHGPRRAGHARLLAQSRGNGAGAARTAGWRPATSAISTSKGRIVITDRKKDLIVNDKGDNVSPQRVEGMLTLQPEIAQAMVYGDRRPYLVALLVPEPEIRQGKPDLQQRAVKGGRPGERRSVGGREGPPLHPRRRAVHDRQRAADAVAEDPPPRHQARTMASGSTRSTAADQDGRSCRATSRRSRRNRRIEPVDTSATLAMSPRQRPEPLLRGHQRIEAALEQRAFADQMVHIDPAAVLEDDRAVVDRDHVVRRDSAAGRSSAARRPCRR